MLEWQNIYCRSRRYSVWICDEEMFFIPLSFWLQNLQHCKGKNGVKYSLRETWEGKGKVKQLGKVCGQMETPPSIHTTSHDELKVCFFLPLLSSHFFNSFFSSLLFFSPLASPLLFSSLVASSPVHCIARVFKELQRGIMAANATTISEHFL